MTKTIYLRTKTYSSRIPQSTARLLSYGDEGEGDGGEGEGGDDAPAWDGKFSPEQQAIIDKSFNERFKKEKQKQNELVTKLKEFESQSTMTQKERDVLKSQIEELEQSTMTERERFVKQQKQKEEEYEQKLTQTSEQAKRWENMFKSSTIERELLGAASPVAVNPQQLVAMFRGQASMVEDLDDKGVGKGTYTPMLKFSGLDADKKETVLEMPIGDAIAKLKADGLNDNLFKHDAKTGTGYQPNTGGQKNNAGGGPPERSDYPDTEAGAEKWGEAYRAYRMKEKG